MGIRTIDTEKCNGCGNCVKICPQDVLRIEPSVKKPVIKYLRDCQSCFLCEIYCPQGAIYVSPFRERRGVLPW
ncbi:MAG TPA: ferredoxin family protein [Clostridia bacterium]|nr:ferredoxin family protein [Clostridia bacterium]